MGFKCVCEGIYLLSVPHGGTTTGVVLVRGDENYLIDAAGKSAEVDEYIIPALKALSLSPKDIECLIPTHTHADHIGGFKRMREAGVKSIAAYERSVPKIKEPLKYNVEIRMAFPENSPPPSIALCGEEVDKVLYDGDILGGRLEIIAAPGHDSDTVCIYDRVSKTLICGDSVQLNGTTVQGCGAYMYLDDYRASLKRLMQLDTEALVLGHPFLPYGEVTTGSAAVKELLEKALALTYDYRDFVRSRLSAGEGDMLEIARELVEHVGGIMPDYMFLPLYSVREHMEELK